LQNLDVILKLIPIKLKSSITQEHVCQSKLAYVTIE